MTKYEQKPSGWWQDSKNRMQPPGSYRDAALRITADSERPARRGSSSGGVRRFLNGVWKRPSAA